MKTNITILDLAKYSGVGKSTVSRYLRGESVSDKTAKKIEDAISQTGYIRNNYAQLLRTSHSNFIGVIIPDFDNPFFLSIVKRLDKLSYEQGKTLIIKTSLSSFEREMEALQFIRGFRVEAIFLCRTELTEAQLNQLNIQVPVISIDKQLNGYISVLSNNLNNGYILAKHVFRNTEDGKVMFFSRLHESKSVIDRFTGYEAACMENNQEVLSYKYDREKAMDYEKLKAYVLKHQVKSIIARNDNEAIKIHSYFNQLYYKGDMYRIKVAGFDNIRLAGAVIPRLTSIDQKIENICDIAYDKFVNFKESEIKTYVCDSELIIRESTL